MRLIDADALKRKEQKIATETWKMKVKASVESILNQFIDHIDHAPTVDAVEVVRCVECKFYNRCTDHQGICMNRYMDGFIVPDWYCADGERLEEDDLRTSANHYGERREE